MHAWDSARMAAVIAQQSVNASHLTGHLTACNARTALSCLRNLSTHQAHAVSSCWLVPFGESVTAWIKFRVGDSVIFGHRLFSNEVRPCV